GAAAPARSRNRVESIGVQRIDFASGSANRLDAPAIKAAGHPDGLEHAVERRTALPGEDAGQREERRRGPVQGRADAGPLPATGRRRAGTPVSEDAAIEDSSRAQPRLPSGLKLGRRGARVGSAVAERAAADARAALAPAPLLGGSAERAQC